MGSFNCTTTKPATTTRPLDVSCRRPPIVPDPTNPQHFNRYTYAGNNPLRYTDPTGHWLETAWDILNIAWDIYEIKQDPGNLWNWAALAVDVGTAILPGVPAFAGMISKGGRVTKFIASHGDEAIDAARAVGHIDEAAQLASRVDEALKAAQELVEVGLGSERSADLINAIAQASTRGDVGSEYVLLGSFPEYIDPDRGSDLL